MTAFFFAGEWILTPAPRVASRRASNASAVLDWKDRAAIWEKAGLTPIVKPMLCKAEPQTKGTAQ